MFAPFCGGSQFVYTKRGNSYVNKTKIKKRIYFTTNPTHNWFRQNSVVCRSKSKFQVFFVQLINFKTARNKYKSSA